MMAFGNIYPSKRTARKMRKMIAGIALIALATGAWTLETIPKAKRGDPSKATLQGWRIENGTGNLIASFPHIAYKYTVERIARGEDCLYPTPPLEIKWFAGDNGEGVCYFTMNAPGWVKWNTKRQWLWLGGRKGINRR
tara:strand:+ start:47 stop:460 length:414 start_codon:yes stop_codon:yes gene_type:complete